MLSLIESLFLWLVPHDQFTVGVFALNNIAPGIIRACKPLHQDMVAIQGGGSVDAVVWTLYQTLVVKRMLNEITDTTAEMSFQHRVIGLFLRDRLTTSVIQQSSWFST